jgi:hypothetical protein
MGNLSQKMLSLPANAWQQIERQLGIRIPKSDFSYSKANPFEIFSAVVREKNRKWIIMMTKAILEFYNLKITTNDEKCYCIGITHTAKHDPTQLARTTDFLADLYNNQTHVYENKRNYPEFFTAVENEQASSH